MKGHEDTTTFRKTIADQSQRTKAAAEEAFLQADPKSTIIRPSIMFGPGDSFFTVSGYQQLDS
jgi:dTDP-4-dehydrorhamnose reductase